MKFNADVNQTTIDVAMMQRCIELSETATRKGEFPFACVICEGGTIVAETTNRVAQNRDVTPCRIVGGFRGATDPRSQGSFPVHPLFKCRALRDVRISYSGNADRACRFCDQVANDGRIFKMERPARCGDRQCHA